jgi:hypothetical protein
MLEPQFDYPSLLSDLKTQIRAARTKAALAVNHELILLYWSIYRTADSRAAISSRLGRKSRTATGERFTSRVS